MNDFQLGLIAVGGLLVAGVVAYNKWQERKHRRLAERAFAAEHSDVLLGEQPEAPAGAAQESRFEERMEPGDGRIEPTIQGEENRDEPAAASSGAADEVLTETVVADPPSALADERVDCIARIEAAEPVSVQQLWDMHRQLFARLVRPLRWIGWDERQGEWTEISPHDVNSFRRLRGVLQLVDRRGPLSEAEYSIFFSGVQGLADEVLAVADIPPRADVLARAAELDRFCASVDVQIGINVVSEDGQVFAGTKLRSLAEAAGLELQGDGLFHALSEDGNTWFTMGNLEPSLFAAEEMKSIVTHGLTLTLDVPRVAQGAPAFDRMVALGRRLADSLGGQMVDDNRAPLSDVSLVMIRKSISQFQDQMNHYGVPAGGALALRLFA